MDALNPMIARVAAATAARDRFLGRVLTWGSDDCAHLAGVTLEALGYAVPWFKYRAYSTEGGARRALRKAGHADTLGLIDAMPGVARTNFARALPADLIALPPPEETALTPLAVVLGHNRALMFHVSLPGFACAVVHDFGLPVACWSCPPCPKPL
jgi:hypothetical protein